MPSSLIGPAWALFALRASSRHSKVSSGDICANKATLSLHLSPPDRSDEKKGPSGPFPPTLPSFEIGPFTAALIVAKREKSGHLENSGAVTDVRGLTDEFFRVFEKFGSGDDDHVIKDGGTRWRLSAVACMMPGAAECRITARKRNGMVVQSLLQARRHNSNTNC